MTPEGTRKWIGPLHVSLAIFIFLCAVAFLPSPAHAMTYKQARKVTVAQAKRVIRKEAKRAHYGKANTAALLWIAKHESGFHCWEKSHSGCCGLFQLSWGMSHRHHWWDPTWNTRRAIRYIRGRYGSPLKAKAFWLRHRWY